MDSVATRTRSKQDQMYRKIHEEIKKKNLGSSFTGFRGMKRNNVSRNYSAESTSCTLVISSESDDDTEVEEIEVSVSGKGTETSIMKRKNTVERDDLVSKRKRSRYVSESKQTTTDDSNSTFEHNEELVLSQRAVIPLKFTFGIEESPPTEKSEEEKEVDEIWDEMNLYLSATDDPLDTNIEPKAVGNCSHGGEHVFVLDEEIGLKCKFCSFVGLEIKYYTEPFCKYPFGHSERRGCYRDQVDIFDKLDHQELDNETPEGGDFSSGVQGTVWEIIPGIGKDLHTHQREGFLFLWRNIGGGIDLNKLKQQSTGSDNTGGCIISHAPGTGKTRLAIVFLQTYMELYPKCRPIVIAPCSILNSWEDEFRKWNVDIPFLNLKKSSGKRSAKLMSWKRKKSVLGLSYRLFEELVKEDKKKCIGRKKSENETMRRILLQVPELLVLDEGHYPRNDNTLVLQALSRIRTKKRIILSGTPFQNNFNELFNTLCLARPQFLHSLLKKDPRHKQHYHDQTIDAARREWKRITDPICEENCNPRLKAASLNKVRDMINPFVQVYKGNILEETLPGLRETVIKLKPDELQKGFLDRLEAKKDLSGLNLEVGVSLVSVHPCLMPNELVQKGESDKLQSMRLNSNAGVKTKFVMQLIRRSVGLNEKVLVFSQFRSPLKLISEQLVAALNWMVEREILEINGTVSPDERKSRIKCFNDARSEAKVMLATTKTCSEGINFVGASRVVLVDVVWNPQVERQAISRAYRLGQTKVVYIYHLITCGTMEEHKYRRQTEKVRVSDLVFCSSERAQNQQQSSSNDKKDRILEAMVESNKLKDRVKSIIYQPRDSSFD